jgi:hypothetical protein
MKFVLHGDFSNNNFLFFGTDQTSGEYPRDDQPGRVHAQREEQVHEHAQGGDRVLEGPPALPDRRAHLLQGGHQPEHHHPRLAPEDQARLRAEY